MALRGNLTVEYCGQHLLVLELLSCAAILLCFQGLVNLVQNAPLPANIGQQNPIMAAAKGPPGPRVFRTTDSSLTQI